ncbi:MAG: metal-dependent hydrolase [Halobacteriaceae archaeon]
MYVGHSLLAFALAAGGADALDRRPRTALAAGALAAGFAVVPDTDLAHTVFAVAASVVRTGSLDVFPTTQYVWTESWVVHRALTHSLLVGGAAVVGVVGVAAARRRGREWALVPVCVYAVLLWVAVSGLGALGGATITLYAVAAGVLAWVGAGRGHSPGLVGAAAAVGLLTHPFGDVFMGTPPTFLYPLTGAAPISKITVLADPTLNLLALFGLEVALGWWALATAVRVRGDDLGAYLRPRAALGAGYAGAVFVVPPPTLELAYGWAGGLLAAGLLVGGATLPTRERGLDREAVLVAVTTGLAAVSLGTVAYVLAYLY